jgi:hypothetical protein
MKHEWDAKRIQTLGLQLIIHVMELFECHCVVLPLEEGKFTCSIQAINCQCPSDIKTVFECLALHYYKILKRVGVQ